MNKKDRRQTADRRRTAVVDLAPKKAENARGGAERALGGPDTRKPAQGDVLGWSWGVQQSG